MHAILTAPAQLATTQARFTQALQAALSQKIPCTIAAVNGSFDTEAAYSPELDLWYAQTQDGKKCWNGFGIGQPVAGKKVSIAAEINFPTEGLNRAVSGVFAEDGNGGVWVLHRGKIRGGKELFFRHFGGETLTVKLSPATLNSLLKLMPEETAEYTEFLMAPAFTGEKMSAKEYADSIGSMYGSTMRKESESSFFIFDVSAPGEITEAACTDHTGHSGQIQKTDGCDRGTPCDSRYAFPQVDTKDDFCGAGAHGERRLNEPGIQLGQSSLHLPGEKGDTAEHQWDNGPAHINRRPHDDTGQRHDPCQKDNKGDGAEQADQLVQDLIDDLVFQNAVRLRDREQHAKD